MRHWSTYVWLVVYEVLMGTLFSYAVMNMAPERCITGTYWDMLSQIAPLVVILLMLAPAFSILHDP